MDTLKETIKAKHNNITGIVVQKNGQCLHESYYNGSNAMSKTHVYSVTKSILALLVGVAANETPDFVVTPLASYFPELQTTSGETTNQITVKNLLTMTTPYKYNEDMQTYIRYFQSKNWTEFTLKQLDRKSPTGIFRYTPLIGPDLVSALLTRVTKKDVLTFAKEKLFTPLGIQVEEPLLLKSEKEQMEFNSSIELNGWVQDETGLNAGGWGLTLSPNDLLKIGQLILNEGRWNDHQIIPKKWLKEMQTVHSFWEKEQLPYGYLWWIIDAEKPIIAAMGDGGNILYIDHEQQLIVAITALFKADVYDRVAFIRDELLPALEG